MENTNTTTTRRILYGATQIDGITIAVCSHPAAAGGPYAAVLYNGFAPTDASTVAVVPAATKAQAATTTVRLDQRIAGRVLAGWDLSGMSLFGADLRGTNLRGANLVGCDLSGANMSYSDLSGANMSYSDLSGANMRSANLLGIRMIGAKIDRTVFVGSEMDPEMWEWLSRVDGAVMYFRRHRPAYVPPWKMRQTEHTVGERIVVQS